MSGNRISDFIAHRWADAKAELSKLDPEFVAALEGAVRLNNIGLYAPGQPAVDKVPKRRLPSGWHELLEGCLELQIQIDCLETAAQLLTPSSNEAKSTGDIGKEADYHIRSWFVWALALAERGKSVIQRANQLFGSGSPQLKKKFNDRVDAEISQFVEGQRHRYLHPRPSWAAGITEDQHWEADVAVGLLPREFLEMNEYPTEGEKVLKGERFAFVQVTNEVLNRLGVILYDLEGELGL